MRELDDEDRLPGGGTRLRPAAVYAFEETIAEWLASFTAPEALAGEMAEVCAEGAPWAAAIAGVAARRAEWSDTESIVWGLCIGGLAGSLEAVRRSLAVEPATGAGPARSAGPALPLLAGDGLVAAAHEALGALEPDNARVALTALEQGFADGGPWRAVPAGGPRPPWAALVPCALEPAAQADPAGPWSTWAEAWRDRFGPEGHGSARELRELWDHPRADADAKTLMRAAAREATSMRGRDAGG